jgi:hypothetical protein
VQLGRDVRHYKRVVMREEGCHDAVILAAKLSGVGYSVAVKRGLQLQGGAASIFRNLRHEWLAIRGEGDFEGAELIVDPHFREQFAIPHPTQQ